MLAVVLILAAVWAGLLWQQVTSAELCADWWAQPRGEPGGLVYVALGDSATRGVGATPPSCGYVGFLADRIREHTGRPVTVINLGRSGATVRDVVREQLPQLAKMKADVVTVGVGGNDIRDYEPDWYRADVADLVAGLPPGTVVADIPYFMHGQSELDAEQAAETIRRLAEERGLVVAPLHETTRARGWTAMFTDYAPDWFHPNDRGYRVWAESFWSVLEPQLATR